MAHAGDGRAVLKGTPLPKGAPARTPRGPVQDALDSLERRRKPQGKPGRRRKRGDLDLDSIQ